MADNQEECTGGDTVRIAQRDADQGENQGSSMTKNKLYIIAAIAAVFGVCAYQAGDMPYAAGSLLVAGVISLAAWAVE